MLDLWFREHLETQAIADVRKLLPRLNYNRRASMVHYAFALFGAIVAFWVLFAAHVLAARDADTEHLVLAIGVMCSALVVVFTQYLKRNPTFIDAVLRGQIRISNYLRKRTLSDPLYYQFHIILIVLCLPLLVLSGVTAVYWNGTPEVWVSAGSEAHVRNTELIKQFMSFSLAIAGAQLALFTFMFSYLLGRYSSQIVKSLITHRAVVFAWVSSISALTLL